jgi:hypothetical protein
MISCSYFMSLPTTWKRWIRYAPMRYRLLIILILQNGLRLWNLRWIPYMWDGLWLIHLKGKKPIKYKWIFKRMTSIDEDVQAYKDFCCYSCIPWLWDLTNGCQNWIPEWKSSRKYVNDITWRV